MPVRCSVCRLCLLAIENIELPRNVARTWFHYHQSVIEGTRSLGTAAHGPAEKSPRTARNFVINV